MLRKKLNNIIKDIDRQIRTSEIVDTAVEFEKIRIVEDFRKENKIRAEGRRGQTNGRRAKICIARALL